MLWVLFEVTDKVVSNVISGFARIQVDIVKAVLWVLKAIDLVVDANIRAVFNLPHVDVRNVETFVRVTKAFPSIIS